MIQAGDSGTRLAIRLLQDAAERGDIEPWDVDVIAVVDGFLDQLRQKLELPRLIASAGGSYEQDLAESSEAFLAASVLVSLKAEHLEASTFQAAEVDDDDVDLLLEQLAEDDGDWPALRALPSRPEKLLQRRTVAPPPLQRPVTLGELIRQLEDIGERLEQEGSRQPKQRRKRYSDREAIAQVASSGAPREVARNHRSPQPISEQLGCGLGVAAVRWPRCRLGSRGSRGSRSRPGWGVLGAAVSLQSGAGGSAAGRA